MKKITVLMSVYNGQKYLRQSIESILNQSYPDFEFLIINDASLDCSREIICSYNDKRIRLVDNKTNIGLTRSLNIGVNLAESEYIVRQDADDISLSLRLQEMLEFIQDNKNVVLLGSSYIEIDEYGNDLNAVILNTDDKEIKRNLLFGNYFGFEMIKRSVILDIGGYNDEFRYAQDYDLCLRISENNQVANIKNPLYKRRVHQESISIYKKEEQSLYAFLARDLAEKRKSGLLRNKQLQQYVLEYKKNIIIPTEARNSKKLNMFLNKRQTMANFHFKMGVQFLVDYKLPQSRNQFIMSFKNNPIKLKVYPFFLLSFFPVFVIKKLRKIKRLLCFNFRDKIE